MSDLPDATPPAWAAAMEARLEGRLERMHDDFRAELVRTRADIMARIDRLQDRVEAMADDIGVNFGRADRVGERAESALREVRLLAAEVTAMERQIRRLRADVDSLKDDRGGGAAA